MTLNNYQSTHNKIDDEHSVRIQEFQIFKVKKIASFQDSRFFAKINFTENLRNRKILNFHTVIWQQEHNIKNFDLFQQF